MSITVNEELNGVLTNYSYTNEGVLIKREQDCDAIIDYNHAVNVETGGWTESREFQKIASVPLVWWEAFESEQKKLGLTDEEITAKFLLKLRSGDYAKFKTSRLSGKYFI